ncbi:MAG: SMC family ATPase [Yaniella sp.]|uniref:AAA family ATPase n=1 Tax=Yaniella sp. TaxID=2773929 RepID=UPI00264990B7|nr:SMC family ATPase [Yaniella sp.]MDN5732168.1 SMC family ATPase [Yaniella sp.]
MRIHRLTFQAIGPYPGKQDLAFEQLDAAGLFLLDGPTGAGKSTILDVVTFALYGKADDERKNTELHSTLAEPGTPPTITLDVSFGLRRFVIDRVLQHFAPRRGAKDADDVVTRQASIALSEVVEGQSQQLTTRVDEAQQILRSVIGLSREQFTSVVLLPQGEFARFLKASSNDREAILRQLFNTHRFDEIGDYLSQQAKTLRSAVESDSQRRESLRAVLIQTAETYAPAWEDDAGSQHLVEQERHGSDETAALDLDALSDAELIEHVESRMTALQAHAQQRVAQASTTLETTRKKLTDLQEQQTQLREATDFRTRRVAHEAQAAEAKSSRQQLDDHARAKPVVDAQNHLDTATQQLNAAVESWQHHFDAAQDDDVIGTWARQAAEGHQLFAVDLDDVPALCDQWKTIEATAIRAREQVQQHEKAQSSIAATRKRLAEWKRSHAGLTKQLQDFETTFATLTEQLDANRARAEELSGAENTLQTAQQRLEETTAQQTAAKKAQTAYARTEQTQQVRDTAKQTADKALEHAQQLLRRRIDAAAGFLAEQLEEDQPCEVCGSTSHPAPAQLQDATEISNVAVQAAEQQATEARRGANDAEQDHQTQLTALHDMQTRAGGLSVADADDAVATAQHTVATAQQQVNELTTVRTRTQEQEARVETLRQDKATAEKQLTEATTQVSTITAEVERAEAELTEALGAFETVEQLRSATEPAYRLVGQIVAQGAQVSTAVTACATAAQRVAQALEDSAAQDHPAFDDAKSATTCILSPGVYAEHEALVRQWTTEKDRLEEKAGQAAVVAGLKLLDADVAAPSNEALESAREAQQAAQVQLAQANREHGSIEATHQQVRGQQRQLDDVSKRSAEQLAVYEELVGLSDVVAGRGENTVAMPLRSFVLAGWLEQVAANASERLTGMTGGRYELKHAIGQGGRGYAGLNLEVIDHLNDTVRNPSTLSGGETFMASLALALGLADAVQAQAGGVSMDTLFIDEGFGSLDADTLEDVMGVLDALQDDGRLIGLVSHVESMKQQIPHRIQVQKTQTGSNVRVIGPDVI